MQVIVVRAAASRVLILWLLGLPPVIYLVFVAWLELGLPFPTLWAINWTEGLPNGMRIATWPAIPTFFYFDDFSGEFIYPLDAPFRRFVAPLVLIGILAGLGTGLARGRLGPIAPFLASGGVILAYGAFLLFDGWSNLAACGYQFHQQGVLCYEPASYLRNLGVHDHGHGARAFLTTIEVLGVTTVLVCMSIWAGVGALRIAKAKTARITSLRRVIPEAESPADLTG